MTAIKIVVPCFNEAHRFNPAEVQVLLQNPAVSLLLVDDGSTDDTRQLLDQIADTSERISVLGLTANQGKAEAVRQGMNLAIKEGARVTGYLDGDFATPALEALRLVSELESSDEIQVVMGARWLHLGSDIQRNTLRHYGGRVFATLASQALNLRVYDTQCGAKLFRVNDSLKAALATGFVSPWAFDVELIGRLKHFYSKDAFIEIALNQWVDVAGSKITLLDMIRATLSLLALPKALRNWRLTQTS